MLKAVIFDFDGVVADSEFLHYKTFNGAIAKYEVTIDDPFTYTRPWASEWTVKWIAGGEIEERFCED